MSPTFQQLYDFYKPKIDVIVRNSTSLRVTPVPYIGTIAEQDYSVLRTYAIVYSDLGGEHTIAMFHLQQFPGCCGVAVVHGARVYHRNRGIGTILNTLSIHLAKALGYTTLFCTDVTNNTPCMKILQRNKWSAPIHEFRNLRTSNDVGVYSIDLVSWNPEQ